MHGLEPAERISLRSAHHAGPSWPGNRFPLGSPFLLAAPAGRLTVVATLAVGIGVNAAAFSVLNAIYLKKLPIANADRFVSIAAKDGGSFTYPEYLAFATCRDSQPLIAGGRTSTTLDSTIDDARTRSAS